MSNETINNRLKIISDLSDEMRKLKAMKEDSLDEDLELQELQEDVKEIRSRLSERKTKIMTKTTIPGTFTCFANKICSLV